MQQKFISVCSGIEAATEAWAPLGWNPQFYSEIDKFPSAVLEYRHPEVPNLGDMTKFKEWNDYDTDVLVGGTPCQSFSVAGLRKGLDDPRGNLMLTYLAIADRYRPRWVVWENVPGVLSSNKGRDFGTFLGALGQLGYGWSYRVLDAQYFGVPQRRRRVFVVGCLGGWQRAAAVLFEQHCLLRNTPPSRKAGEKVALYSSTGAGYWKKGCGALRGRNQDSHENLIAGTIAATYGEQSGQDLMDMSGGLQVVHGTQDPITSGKAFPLGTNNGGENVICFMGGQGSKAGSVAASSTTSPTLRSADSGSNRTPCVAFAQNTRNEVRTSGVVGALSSGGGKPGQGQQGMQVRRLTPIECERLQGFSDNYTRIPWRNKPAELCPDGPRYKALGNSMAVPVMKWIGERIEMVEMLGNLQDSN